jgi:hypothetical protein
MQVRTPSLHDRKQKRNHSLLIRTAASLLATIGVPPSASCIHAPQMLPLLLLDTLAAI